jgi:cytochrome c peroxidase
MRILHTRVPTILTLATVATFMLSRCGDGARSTDTTTAPMLTAEQLQAVSDLRAQALTLFSPLPTKVEHPAGPDTPEKVALGHMLFMDPRLSVDSSISCNSCHRLDAFGADSEPTSTGVEGQKGGRNSPTVYNAALHNLQFWDGRAVDVEQQAGMPVLNPVEMAIPDEQFLVDRLRKAKDYPALFRAAFPGTADPLTYANIREAVGAFERTLVTPSRFDAFLTGDNTAMDSVEMAGLRTFMDVGCATCHNGAAVGGTSLKKFGVHKDYRALTGSPAGDVGREQVTGDSADRDVFKVPGLRNITRTAPYFHDGRVTELDRAIRVMAEAQLGKALTAAEVESLRAFLELLTGERPAFVAADSALTGRNGSSPMP